MAALAFAPTSGASVEAPPRRVVSMNVCADQLAMLIAAPGQLYSVSHLASDPQVSVMTKEAERYTVNHGLAEEIFLMRPDLVIAGTYTTRATVTLLRRLGFVVEEFAPAVTFDDIRTNMRRMGMLLGRERRADMLLAEFDDNLARLRAEPFSGYSAAVTFANSYTSGAGTLSQAVLEAAGLENIAAKLGIAGTSRLPLELLIISDPDLVVAGEQDYGAPALAAETFVHPAYKALGARGGAVSVPSKYWICGTPSVLQAVQILRSAVTQLQKDAEREVSE